MNTALQASLSDQQFHDRRRRLQRAIADVDEEADLARLLQEVDSALNVVVRREEQ